MIFEIKGKKQKYFNSIAFLTKALLTDDPTRPFMNIINVETENDIVYCVSTNGKIMHIVEFKNDETPIKADGYYSVKTNTKDIIILEKTDSTICGNFPNWRNITKNMIDYVSVVERYYLTFDGLKDKSKVHSIFELTFILNNLGYCFHSSFLQSIAVMNRHWDIYLNPYKQCAPFKLVSENHTAIICPYTVDATKPIVNAVGNAFEKLDKTLKEVSNNAELFNTESIVKRRKYLWEE